MVGSHARRAWIGGLGASLLTLAAMLATGPRLAPAWDEVYTIARLERVRLWFDAVRDPARVAGDWHPERLRPVPESRVFSPTADQIDTRGELFAPAALVWFWPFAREEPHGHPPFYAIVALAGDVLAPGLPELARARLGTMLAFSLTAGALFVFLARRFGGWAGGLAAGAWGLQPHLFALGHYATYDALLSSLWVGALLAFACAVEPGEKPRRSPRWGWAVFFGVLLGAAMGTKLTGWLLPLPFLGWMLAYRDSRGLLTLFVGGLVALVAVYAFTPPWWPDPLAGLARFFASNLSRQETIPIKTMFLGRIYETPGESLPWYNTLVWTGLVTPVGFLGLALVGVWRALRRGRAEPFGVLVLIHWVFLLTLRALPHTPGHDGVRQFLPAFGCLALLTGLGAGAVVEWFGRRTKPWLIAALVEGVVSVAVMMPVPLSYFSPLVGGLPGAAAIGMEPTFYWDSLTDEALAAIDARTPEGRVVLFIANPVAWYYRETGRLEAALYNGRGPAPAWVILQNRPGAMSMADRQRVARLGTDPRYILNQKLGVPLVWAFPGPDAAMPRADE